LKRNPHVFHCHTHEITNQGILTTSQLSHWICENLTGHFGRG